MVSSGPNVKNIIAGSLLVAFGLSVSIYCWLTLPMGTVRQMGAGMFPVSLGVVLIFLGALVAIPAFARANEPVRVDLRPLLAVAASILVFALLVRPLGLVPATIALALVAGLADGKYSPLRMLALGLCLSILAVAIFKIGLSVQLPAIAFLGF